MTHRDWKVQGFIKWFQEIFIIATSVISAWFVSFVIKNAAHVARPFVAHTQVVTLIPENTLYDSFPSGHATIFFALATALYIYDRRIGGLFYVFAALIALSRVIAGVHYPFDIVIGAIIGIVVTLLVHRALSSITSRKSTKPLSK
jgi:undecaprenyl-diphosphatase